MTSYKTWTVIAIDECNRQFNYTQAESPTVLESLRPELQGEMAEWTFRKAVHKILKEMGEAVKAEWWCEPGVWEFDDAI